MRGSYAYVAAAGTSDSLVVVDVSTPSNPSLVGSTAVSSGTGYVVLSGSYAYVPASGSDSLVVVDVSTPSSPFVVGSVSNATAMNGVRRRSWPPFLPWPWRSLPSKPDRTSRTPPDSCRS